METPNPESAPSVDVPAPSERDTLLAELDALGSEPENAEEPTLETSEEQNASEDEAEQPIEEPSEEPQEEGEAELADVDAKKLATLQRQEKRQKEQFAQRESEIQAREQALAEREQQTQAFEDLKARAAYDAAGVLEALGVKPELFEETARDLFSRRPGAEPDNQTRAAIKQRETQDSANKALEEINKLRQELAEEKSQMDLERRANTYMDKAAELVDDDAPIVARMLGNNPAKFRELVGFTANKLWQESGETPEHLDVIREMENIKRAELLDLGFELPKGNSQQSAQSPQKSAGRTITNDLVTPTKPRADLSDSDVRDDVLKGMAELEI